jgi:hypothetical protein
VRNEFDDDDDSIYANDEVSDWLGNGNGMKDKPYLTNNSSLVSRDEEQITSEGNYVRLEMQPVGRNTGTASTTRTGGSTPVSHRDGDDEDHVLSTGSGGSSSVNISGNGNVIMRKRMNGV